MYKILFTHGEQAGRQSLETVRVVTTVPDWARKVAVIMNRARCPGQQSNQQDEEAEGEMLRSAIKPLE